MHCNFSVVYGLGSILFLKRSKFSLKTVMKMQTEFPLFRTLFVPFLNRYIWYIVLSTLPESCHGQSGVHALRGWARLQSVQTYQKWVYPATNLMELLLGLFHSPFAPGCLGHWASELSPSSCYEWVVAPFKFIRQWHLLKTIKNLI